MGACIVFAIILFVVIGPHFWKYGPEQTGTSTLPYAPPSLKHPFGTDFLGHDLMSQIMYGAYPSLLVAIVAAIGAVAIGLLVGVFAGYYERFGSFLSGATDVILTFPALVMIILVSSLFLPTSELQANLFIAGLLIVFLWPSSSRAIRAQVASLKRRPFVDAQRTSGVGNLRIVFRVMIPAVSSIALAYFIILTSVGLILTTALEFLGIGNPTVASWGSIYYWAQQYAFASGAWWWVLIPGVFISLFVSGLALIGFAFEEVSNPRLRG